MIHEDKEIDLAERMPYWNGIAPRIPTPLHAMYKRQIDTAIEEARDAKDGLPTDDAIIAMDWLFRDADPHGDLVTYWMSFKNCCHVLNADWRRLRGNIRVYLGYQCIATAQADTARVNALLSVPLQGDDEELFEAIRCVPVLDQGSLFAMDTVH